MKTLKYIQYAILGLCIVYGTTSCNEDPEFTRYEAIPKTEIGRKLVEGTNLIATIYTDTTYTLTKGATATEISYLSAKGLAMHAFFFVVDLSTPNMTVVNCMGHNKFASGDQQLTAMAQIVDAPDNYVLGGINTDYFSDADKGSQGIFHHKGIALKTYFNDLPAERRRSFFYLTKDEKAFVAPAADYPAVAAEDNILEAFGGGPVVAYNGVALTNPDLGDMIGTEPRTCLGVSKDGRYIYIMVVDGRNFYYSNGMECTELGLCMHALGAYAAINLDGGGSSTFITRKASAAEGENKFMVRNWPTDGGGVEREVGAGLLIVTTNK